MKIKEFTLKKKRDGQSWQNVGSFFAISWHDAKKQFTDSIRNDLAIDDQVLYFSDADENLPEDYKGAGYYDINGGYWSLPLLDTDIISGYSEDVYKWTIERVD
jgi:hypothetical protein